MGRFDNFLHYWNVLQRCRYRHDIGLVVLSCLLRMLQRWLVKH